MMNSDVVKTVVNETAEGVRCLPMTIAVTQPLYRVDEQWVGIGFALGFLLGCGMGLFVALNCCKNWFSSHRKVDVESQNCDIKTRELTHYVHQAQVPSYHGYENMAFTSMETDAKYLERTSSAGSHRPMSITPSPDDGNDRCTSAMTSALVKDSSEALAAEIARQDVEATSQLENELWRDRNMLLMQVMQILLNRLHKTGKITTEGATSMQLNLRNNLNNIVRTLDQERQAAELRINADDSLSPEAAESELERLQTELVYKMNDSVKDEEERIRRDFVKVAGLSEKEAEAAMVEFLQDMTRVDALLAERYAHESQKIQHQLSQRLLAAELASQRRAYQNEEIQANVIARREAMNKTAKNNYKLKLYADELMADYEKTVLKLQEKSEAGWLKQQAMLVERLQEKRAAELAEVEKAMATERQGFIARTEKMVQTTDMEKSYRDYIEKQKRQMHDVLDEIDISETNEFDKLLKDVKIQRDKELQTADEAFINKLQDHMSLSAGDVTQLLQAHLAHMRSFTRAKELEKQQYAAILQDRLSDREKRWEEEYAATEAEQTSLTEYQDAAVVKVIDTQMGVDKEARKQILTEHQHNMQMLNNKLMMSKHRQHKILVRKLNTKRAQLAAQRQNRHGKRQTLSSQELLKMDKSYGEIEMQERTLQLEYEQALAELRRKMATETDILLRQQDQQLAAVIGRQQVGRARRNAAIQRQDKTIQQLEAQIADRVVQADSNAYTTEQILHQHMKEVSQLNQHLQQNRQHQMNVLQEKIEAKKLLKERNAESVHNVPVHETKHRGSDVAAVEHSESESDSLSRQMMEELHREMMLDMQGQKQQLDMNMERQLKEALMEQRKSFLAQLAAISDMSEAELQAAVEDIVAKGSNKESRKQAKQLIRDLKKRLKEAREKLYKAEKNERRRKGDGSNNGKRDVDDGGGDTENKNL